MRSVDSSFYKTKAWKNCRAAYISKSGGLCERCLAQGLIVPGVIVHHKIHLNPENIKEPRIALDFNNLELLCYDCHNKEHFHYKKKNRRYEIGDNGQIIFVND